MLTSNPLGTPIKPRIRLSNENHITLSDYLYSQVVGNLMHAIVNSRPDCVYAINNLAQYLSKSKPIHIQTLKRTMRYIKSTLSFRIKYQHLPQGDILHDYFDAD